jgi:nitroreductase
MDTLEAIRKRRSIRKYKDQPVEWEKIVNIVDSARFAPTSGNIQNWKLVVIRESPNKKLIVKACHDQQWIVEADTIIAVIGEPEPAARYYGVRGEHLYTIQNATAVIENILLAATDQGLGSCWVAAFDEDLMRRALMLPEEIIPLAVVTIGYPDEKPDMPPRTEPQHMIFLEKFKGSRKLPMRGYYSQKTQQTAKRTSKALNRASVKIKEKIKALKEKRKQS